MRKIVYYVASSLDGYICGLNEDISGFVGEGSGVNRYLEDLKDYDTVMMGRNTYEFGYRYGLKPGEPAYPHMTHFIFSDSLTFESAHKNVMVVPLKIEEVLKLKQQNGSDIYLCGGGQFAGWLFDHDMIDVLKVKLNPLILGKGVRIFGSSTKESRMTLVDTESYDHGLQIMTYELRVGKSGARGKKV